MKAYKILICIVAFSSILACRLEGQTNLFRSGIFLHHSTGGCIWGPNGSYVSVPSEITAYNNLHGYTGTNAVSFNETWYPGCCDNEWCTWHNIFELNDPENISNYYASNPVIMIKSCFPSASVYSYGNPSDTLNPCDKTVENYKWHWRHIVEVMRDNPNNFFVIWTNAPLVESQTNATEAYNSHLFCKWAKDTLAMGLDPICGAFPPNVYVFDFFHKLVDTQYYLPLVYAASQWDSHPNGDATALVAPQLVTEIFDNAIAYENYTGLKDITGQVLYRNNSSTPMAGVKVVLKQGCCTLIDSTYTDSNGEFSFPDLDPANYVLTASYSGVWGGANADDALLILKAFVGMSTLNLLQHNAADVDASDYINAIDALMVAKRFVGLISAFSIPDWIFETPVVSLTGANNINVSLKGLCSGDVNGSYTP